MVTVDGLPAQSAVDQVLSTTRCVRKGLDTTREVPRELIEDCLRMAMHAPIGSNGLYPHFVVVTDPAKRPAVAGFYQRAWAAYLPLPFSAANLHFEDPVHEAQQAPVVSSAAYLAEHMAEVPALVIPCISPRVDGMPMWVQACIWGSVLPQSWSFMLAARERGLASAWTQIHIQFEEEVAAVLGINHAEVQQAALIAVGATMSHPCHRTHRTQVAAIGRERRNKRRDLREQGPPRLTWTRRTARTGLRIKRL